MSANMIRRRAGLTLIELLITMIVGLVVLSTVTAYVRTTDRSITGAEAREDYSRKGRFLGIILRRDVGEAGVGVTSLPGFGTVGVFGDTIMILKVPYETTAPCGSATGCADPAYTVAPPTASIPANTNTSGCGNTCVRLRRVAAGTALTLQSGMLAVMTQNNTRRLIIIDAVAATAPNGPTDSLSVLFRNATTIVNKWPSVSSGAPAAGTRLAAITNSNTTVQRVDMIAYWRDASNNLWRATRMNPATGAFVGEIITTGCTQFEAELVFQDGSTATSADSTVAGRMFNNINAVTVRATLKSDISDARINAGVALGRTYTFRIQPRNLLYERNRST